MFVLSIPYSFSKATADLQDAPELLEMMKWLRNFGSSAARCWEFSGMEHNEQNEIFPSSIPIKIYQFVLFILLLITINFNMHIQAKNTMTQTSSTNIYCSVACFYFKVICQQICPNRIIMIFHSCKKRKEK